MAAIGRSADWSDHQDELPAIVTHWLQRPDHEPVFSREPVRDDWLALLADFSARRQEKNILRLHKPLSKNDKVSIDFNKVPFPPGISRKKFSFIDLFAGIGGFRLALQGLGGRCVFSCEWDRDAKLSYLRNYGEVPFGDIRQFTHSKITDKNLGDLIPDHDILAGGFPCQPFSLAGVSARQSLGIAHGFRCEEQGNLFFDIIRIAEVKRPAVLLLENVKNLRRHDGGKTFRMIQEMIEDRLGYSFASEVVDAATLVPQRRERCFMVCFRDSSARFEFPAFDGPDLPLSSILEDSPNENVTISERLWEGHQSRTRRNIARGTGFTAYETDIEKPSHTLVARYGKDGKECLIPQNGKPPRMLTKREATALMGFPEEFLVPESKTQAYRQFGNAVVVPVVKRIAEKILPHLPKLRKASQHP